MQPGQSTVRPRSRPESSKTRPQSGQTALDRPRRLRGRSNFAASRTSNHPKPILARLRSQIAAKAAGEIVGFGLLRWNRSLGEPRRDQVLSRRATASGMTLAGRLDLERLPALQTAGHVTGLIGQQHAVNTASYTPDMAHHQSPGAHLYDNRKTGIAPCQSGRAIPLSSRGFGERPVFLRPCQGGNRVNPEPTATATYFRTLN